MEQNNFFQKVNIKVFAIILLFILVFVVILVLSLFRPVKNQTTTTNIEATPTLVSAQIPTGAIIPTPIINVAPNILVNRLGNVSFSVLNPSIPTQASIYSYMTTPIDPLIAQKIASSLSFNDQSNQITTNDGSALEFKDNTKNIIFYLDAGNVQYVSGLIPKERSVNKNQDVIDIAQNFIKTFTPYNSGLSVDQDSVSYLSGVGDTHQVSNFNDADFYDIPFSQKINNLTLYVQFGSSARAHILVDSSGQINKTTLNTADTLTATRSKNLLSLSQLKSGVLNGEGTIVSYGTDDQSGANLSAPDRTVFTSLELAYLKDSVNKIIYPIFVLSGNAFIKTQELPIVVYLPAYK